MVNHVRTLLLGETSSSVAEAGAKCWYIDPSFHPAPLPSKDAKYLGMLFDGATGIDGRIDRVNKIMPFVTDPEFDGYLSMFDGRNTVPADFRPVSADTIHSFYGRLSPNGLSFVDTVVSDPSAPMAFDRCGDVDADSALSSLYERFSHGFETSKRFSCFVYAVVFKLDLAYRRSA